MRETNEIKRLTTQEKHRRGKCDNIRRTQVRERRKIYKNTWEEKDENIREKRISKEWQHEKDERKRLKNDKERY